MAATGHEKTLMINKVFVFWNQKILLDIPYDPHHDASF